jgi:hypothetical protein
MTKFKLAALVVALSAAVAACTPATQTKVENATDLALDGVQAYCVAVHPSADAGVQAAACRLDNALLVNEGAGWRVAAQAIDGGVQPAAVVAAVTASVAVVKAAEGKDAGAPAAPADASAGAQ